tara:strand:- start:1102 stop:2385 length:1284 start_codon:yes stop_codon:yes gene_type:complete
MSFMTGMNAPEVLPQVEEAVDILYDTAQWAWTGGEEASVLDELWYPLGNNCNKWLGEMQNRCVPVFSKMDPEEVNQIWDYLYGMHGDEAYKIFAPSGANPLEDGVALYVIYENEEAQQEALEIMPEYGLSAPIAPEMVTPMGLYLDVTPYEIPGVDTTKYTRSNTITKRRFDAVNEAMENIYSPVFYSPEWRTGQEGTRWEPKGTEPNDVKHMYQTRGNVVNPELRYADQPRRIQDHQLAQMFKPADLNSFTLDEMAKALAVVIAKQENNIGGVDGDDIGYNTNWGKPDKHYGAYQFSQKNWDYWSEKLTGESIKGTPSADVQDAVAELKFKTLLDDFDGDVGAVAAEHYSGDPVRRRFYNNGLDYARVSPQSEHPTMMEYVSYINRAYIHYLLTGEIEKGEGIDSSTGSGYARTRDERLAHETPEY